jgi:hypothetical protein
MAPTSSCSISPTILAADGVARKPPAINLIYYRYPALPGVSIQAEMATILRERGFYSKRPVHATSSMPCNWLP